MTSLAASDRREADGPVAASEAATVQPGATRSPSVLFLRSPLPAGGATCEPPDFFRDLRLDQIVDAIAARAKEYDLARFFRTALTDLDAVAYRQEVMQEVARDDVRRGIEAFAQGMRAMRLSIGRAASLEYAHEKRCWFLDATRLYCDAVQGLAEDLRRLDLRSRGLRAFREYVAGYVGSPGFESLRADVSARLADLSAVRYALLIKDNRVTVLPYDGEADYTAEVDATFEKCRRGPVKDYRTEFADAGRLNHVEARVLERVAWLYPTVFAALDVFCTQHAAYLNETIARFDREIQFYVAYLAYLDPLRRAGLRFCYPQLSDRCKAITSRDAFDLALAAKLAAERAVVVRNDVDLHGRERILVVSGPNQGGKTTFARMVGQLHYLASLGCPVPGTEARLFLCDRIFVHFERVEDIRSLRGKLKDDLVRMRAILDRATPNSLVILNELFASTTLEDATFLSRKVLTELSGRDLLAVYVTFLAELASFDDKTVSAVSAVDPGNPTVRTFKVERRPPDGLAYALAIAEKHGVTYDRLTERLKEPIRP
jgi:hypothetical protein